MPRSTNKPRRASSNLAFNSVVRSGIGSAVLDDAGNPVLSRGLAKPAVAPAKPIPPARQSPASSAPAKPSRRKPKPRTERGGKPNLSPRGSSGTGFPKRTRSGPNADAQSMVIRTEIGRNRHPANPAAPATQRFTLNLFAPKTGSLISGSTPSPLIGVKRHKRSSATAPTPDKRPRANHKIR